MRGPAERIEGRDDAHVLPPDFEVDRDGRNEAGGLQAARLVATARVRSER